MKSLLEAFIEEVEASGCARVDWNAKSLSEGALLMDLAVATLVQPADVVEADICRDGETVNGNTRPVEIAVVPNYVFQKTLLELRHTVNSTRPRENRR